MIGRLSSNETRELLDRAQAADLGCHEDGRPYVVPISFVHSDDRLLGAISRGKTVDFMRENPEVCLSVNETTDQLNWKNALVVGHYQELEGAAACDATSLLCSKYGSLSEETTVGAQSRDSTFDHLVVFSITISEMSGRFRVESVA